MIGDYTTQDIGDYNPRTGNSYKPSSRSWNDRGIWTAQMVLWEPDLVQGTCPTGTSLSSHGLHLQAASAVLGEMGWKPQMLGWWMLVAIAGAEKSPCLEDQMAEKRRFYKLFR